MITEKITEEELEFMQCWHNPICLAESLFSDFDNLSEFKETFGCIAEGSKILLFDGSIKNIEDIQIGDEILAYDTKTKKYIKDIVRDKIDSGNKNVFEIKVADNKLYLTPNHLIYTALKCSNIYNWREARKIKDKYYTTWHRIYDNEEEYLKGQLFGLFLSNGSYYKTKRNRTKLVLSQNAKCEEKAIDWLLSKLKMTFTKSLVDDNKNYHYNFRFGKKGFGGKSKCIDYYRNSLAKLKQNKDFQLGFLSGLFLGNGCYDKCNNNLIITQKQGRKSKLLEYVLKKVKVNYSKYFNSFTKINKYTFNLFAFVLYNPYSIKIRQIQDAILNNKVSLISNKNKGNIEVIYSYVNKRTFDLTTDSHSFIANGIIVHNSMRLYQYPFLSSESFIDTEMPNLSKKEQFELRKGAGDIYVFGGRLFGKSLVVQKIDICLDILHEDNIWEILASADAIHLQDVLDCVTRAVNFHPILRMWKRRCRASPKYELEARNGFLLQSVNMNVNSKDSGKQFFGKHSHKIRITEASLENQASYEKRRDAVSEFGAVFRCDGMTNFTKFMPAGRAFYDPKNKNKICNLPQYVNPTFDDKKDKERQEEFGGKDSLSYRIFIGGEVIEDGVSEIDMERINPYIDEKEELKIFEIKKESFHYFKNLIVVERPQNCQRIFICADIGDGAGGSEIIILGEIGNKYQYLYRIALYSLKDDEQWEIIDWLVQKLQANVIGFDCGDGTGRSLYRRAEKKYPIDNLVRYAGVDKIGVDFKKNDKGQAIIEDGKPVFIEEFQSDWSMQFLKKLLYAGRILMPRDYKLLNQLNSVISRTVGTRTVYACVSETGDHVIDAFKVFAIAVWLKKDFNTTPKLTQEWGIGVTSWDKSKRASK